MDVIKINNNQIDQITEFIYKLNNCPKHHIGYCSKIKLEIKSEISELIENGNNFFAVYNEDKLSGVIGYEKYDDTVEIWGPFTSEQDIDNESKDIGKIKNMLWDTLLSSINDNSLKYCLHCNFENISVRNFASDKGFKVIAEGKTMTLDLKKLDIPIFENIFTASEKDFEEFETLHDMIFPQAYYSGKEITELLDKEHILFVAKEDNKVAGYIFVKMSLEIDDAYIDFIGVDSNYRSKGYGKKLLYTALKTFKENGISSLLLWVNKKNEGAIKLYENIGFITVDDLVGFSLQKAFIPR